MRLLFLLLLSTFSFGQKVKIEKTLFTINHGDITFYLDSDTNSLISTHIVTYDELLKIDGNRDDNWHKEYPYGSYKKSPYSNSGYDLGHLTPSNITSYDDSLNFHSFSYFNQSPQLASFNRGKWSRLEKSIIDTLKLLKSNGIIITGVIYDNNKKTYLGKSRIKIPIIYYKILIINKKTIICWSGSNVNGEITKTNLKTISELNSKNKNKVKISIK
jgi:DNA/RNA endonuclease G (NUC1)